MKDRSALFTFRERILPSLPKPIRVSLRLVYHKVMAVKWMRNLLVTKASLQACQGYWYKPPLANQPHTYIEGELRSQFLLRLIRECTTKDGKILEIGCNVGRNLNALYLDGYKSLCGIEICTDALELLRQTYPSLGKNCRFYNAPVEDAIGSISDREYNTVFTLAVLEHIHPDSEWIFHHVTRVAKKHLITIEDEHCYSGRHFPRNYREVFENLGMRQIKEVHCDSRFALNENFVARVFVHKNSKEVSA